MELTKHKQKISLCVDSGGDPSNWSEHSMEMTRRMMEGKMLQKERQVEILQFLVYNNFRKRWKSNGCLREELRTQ